MKNSNHNGFTLVSMLAAVAIVAILSAVGTVSYRNFGKNARDAERIGMIDGLTKALALYYEDNGHYPPVSGGQASFTYRAPGCDPGNGASNNWYKSGGGVSGNGIRMDFTSNPTFLEALTPQYFNRSDWHDPIGGVGPSDGLPFNCVYVISMTSKSEDDWPAPSSYVCDAGSRDLCPHPNTYKEIQHYYLHCRLESKFEAAENDGGPVSSVGAGNYVYEAYEPFPWLCLRELGCSVDSDCPNGLTCTGERCS